MLFNLDEIPTVETEHKVAARRVYKPIVKEQVFAAVADVHNALMTERAGEIWDNKLAESRETYSEDYDPRNIARVARAVLARVFDDCVCKDMLISNDPNMNDTAAQQIRAIRYIIRRDVDFFYWCELASVDGESDEYVDGELVWELYIRALLERELIKRVGDRYVIVHKNLLGGIWSDDEARKRAGEETVESE